MSAENKTQEPVMTKEVAEKDFQRFLDGADVDFDIDSMDEDDKATAEKGKNRLVRALMNGHLTIDEGGSPTYTPYTKGTKYTDSITFKPPTGADFMSMDLTKARKIVAKTHSMMAGMSGLSAGIFAKLQGEDYKICQALFLFFMD